VWTRRYILCFIILQVFVLFSVVDVPEFRSFVFAGMQMLSVINVSRCSCLWTIASTLFCTGVGLFVGVLDSADLREDACVFWG
jgi:hypothetical protein